MVDKYVVACYGIVLKDGNLLMVRQGRGHWADQWILPGGKLETGESFESCVEREIFEETGCRAKAIRQLSTISSYSPDSMFEKQVILIFYLCQHVEGEPAKGDGVNAALWISKEQFARMVVNEVVPRQVLNIVSSICIDTSNFPGVFFNFTKPRSAIACREFALPGGGFAKKPLTGLSFMNETYYGLQIFRLLDERPPYVKEMIQFVAGCQNENGGFRRALASGISGFETSYYALESLKVLTNVID